jgi:hypothetical protein
MSTTIWKLVRTLSGLESGVSCRRCSQAIFDDDPFGVSETVCSPCREAAR